tara:strand:+ start:784 stop:1734 length:951 start_codon:yes stop_codon:yes gene_type:complete
MSQINFLQVDAHHRVAYETTGSKQGIPLVFLHGGPGSGYSEASKSFFEQNRWFATFIDQRGCGNSAPQGSIVNNTTAHLVSDIEEIRKQVKVDKWVVFGGSWGSTLALKYAISFPEKVYALILRGIFLGTRDEINWFINEMGRQKFPKTFSAFQQIVPNDIDTLQYYYDTIFGHDQLQSLEAVRRWENLERAGMQLSEANLINKPGKSQLQADNKITATGIEALNRMKIHLHYLKNNCFLKDNELIDTCHMLGEMKVSIIHGSEDPICPKKNALKLHNQLKSSKLELLKNAGHDAFSPKIKNALTKALENIRKDLI